MMYHSLEHQTSKCGFSPSLISILILKGTGEDCDTKVFSNVISWNDLCYWEYSKSFYRRDKYAQWSFHFNYFFHTIYFTNVLPSLNFSQLCPTWLPIQLYSLSHTISLFLSLRNKNHETNKKPIKEILKQIDKS